LLLPPSLVPLFPYRSTYLITQFQALGTEVRTFTSGHISATTAVLVAAGILLIFDLMGGMRSVAYTDVLQVRMRFSCSHLLDSHGTRAYMPRGS
jgi:Na+(H+)/acetate symporter ActP